MSKVTAVGMDVVTEKSGHVVAPVTPSVCLTPAAPSPMPVPYPATGTSNEGIAGASSHTKINGAKIATVGSALKTSHGNEPGTLKEIVSHNTAGPVAPLLGAPVVLIEQGMAAITGSPVLINEGPGSTARTAPAPQVKPAMAVGTLVQGAGKGKGGSSGGASDGGNGDEHAGGEGGGDGAGGDSRDAPGGQDGQCSDGHPVDVITGRAYTLPAIDLELHGPLPLVFARTYSTSAAQRDVGLGAGWAHSWGWEIEVGRFEIVVWSEQGIAVRFPRIDIGAEHVGPWGWVLRRERERFVLDAGDEVFRVFAATDERAKVWRLIELRDRNGNTIELTYDEDGRLVEVLDSAGRTIAIEATRDRRIAALHVKNARSQGRWIAVARYSYSEAGDLVAAFDAEGHATRYEYDGEHRLIREVDRAGLCFCFVYDRAGRCVETWGERPGRREPSLAESVPALLADGRTRARGIHHVRLDYHPERYTEVTDSRGVRRYFGNDHGLVTKSVVGGDVDTALYDERGLMLAREDGVEAVTRYHRDARGQVVRVVDALGRATTYERARGLVIKIVDPAGGVYELHRDERGNVIHEADPTGAVTSTTYNERGLVTSITGPTGGVTRFTYDDAGNVVERVEPNGAHHRAAYDALGRRVLEIDALGNETRFVWTARGDLAAAFHADGTSARYSYDGARHLIAIDGRGQRRHKLAWGGFGKLIAKTNALGQTVALRYDREGDLVEVENEKGELHKLSRNAGGYVVREETFDGRRIAYRYDHAGRVVRSACGDAVVELAYNAAGELTARVLDEDTVEGFTYNTRGELTRVAWTDGEVRFERDAVGRVLRELQSHKGEEHAVASLYDKSGERVRRFTTRGLYEHIERDATGARTRTILDELHDVGHARDALGREVMRALPRGGRVHQKYDPAGRVMRRWSTSAGSLRPVRVEDPKWISGAVAAQPDRVTVEREYAYTEEGELSDARDQRRPWVQYEHDGAGRLLSVFHEATQTEERFKYDPAGYHHRDGEEREYGPGGRLLRRGDTLYAWDATGRLREKREGGKVWRYAWNAAGRLTAIELPDGRRAEYAYDPLGRRVEAREGGDRTRFVWDGDTIAHAIRTRAVREGDPIVEERTFCFEDGGFVPWAQRDDVPDGHGGRRREWSFFVNDQIGTPNELVDGRGVVLAELDREAWGKTENGERTPLRFQGQIEDPETGLFYNRFRYYDADAGLYISPDPIGLAGGLRPFGYGINPTGWIDPLGLTIGPYGQVKGHHIHAKSAFEGHPTYDADAALAIGRDEICGRGLSHEAMTAKQQNLFKEVRDGKRPNTMREHDEIAEEAMIAGGVPPDEAAVLVRRSRQNLRQQGVTTPTRIPWER